MRAPRSASAVVLGLLLPLGAALLAEPAPPPAEVPDPFTVPAPGLDAFADTARLDAEADDLATPAQWPLDPTWAAVAWVGR